MLARSKRFSRFAKSDPTSVARIVNGPVRESLTGKDPFDIERIVEEVLDISGGNVDVPAGVDPALWDIMGKSLGQPVYKLLGGLCQDPIPVDHTIGGSEPAAMAEEARQALEKGFRGVVVKVDAESIERDVQRVRSVRDVLPAGCTVRVDCNGGFSRDTAKQFLESIAGMDIEFVEQPVAASDIEGLRACRTVGVPISVDESVITLRDALEVVSHNACDIMNIKVPRVGGLLLAKRMVAVAAAAGVPVVVGGRTALQLSRYTSRHLAASTPGSIGRKHEGPGPLSRALSDDVVTNWTTQKNGYVRVERSPGMGYEIVWDKVQRYAMSS